MKRLSVPLAIATLIVAVGTVAAFTAMPDAAGPGLQKAGEASGKTVPVRPAAVPPDAASHGAAVSAAAQAEDLTPDTNHGADVSAVARGDHGQAGSLETLTADLPDAATHGATVSAAAQAEDTTPDTNHGADVSAVARANHGQATAAGHRPADTGKPENPGKPENAGH